MTKNGKPLGETLGWTVVDSAYPYESKWFKLRRDVFVRSGAGTGTYAYVEHPGSVFVVPVTEDGRVLLVRSYRFPRDAWCWEVPAGTLADRQNASPESVALEELHEEAGATCRHLEFLGKFYLGHGYANHCAHFYLAMDSVTVTQRNLDAFEQIAEVRAFSVAEIRQMLRNGALDGGDSAFALFLALPALVFEPTGPRE